MKTENETIHGKRILLVDDERVLRETIRRLLAMDKHIVVEANNGAEALGLFKRQSFHLVMTDYEMPFVKGNELASRIRSIAPEQPILMMTGYGHAASHDNPVDAVISKPLNVSNGSTMPCVRPSAAVKSRRVCVPPGSTAQVVRR